MNLTLLDEQGAELTEIGSRLGRSPGQMLVERATRPDALFQYYFEHRRRTVTAVMGAARWTAVLGTRWQKGARSWMLHEFRPAISNGPAISDGPARSDEPATSDGAEERVHAAPVNVAAEAGSVPPPPAIRASVESEAADPAPESRRPGMPA